MPNHLASETSPYLLQHAGNPVDWYPWGAEALALSREGDRPIFLSIGYSACHWCHVMEHESFENHEIANLLNQWFVCIKVDREERPDLDQIYMSAVQAMTGSGGWPMSVFLTPELKPFFGGTYWPPTAQRGRAGFREILASVRDAWIQRRPAVEDQANELTQHLRELAESSVPPTALTDGLLRCCEWPIASTEVSAPHPSFRTRWICGWRCDAGSGLRVHPLRRSHPRRSLQPCWVSRF